MCFGKVGKKNHNLTGSRGWEGDKGDGQNFELPGSRGREAGHHRPGTARHPKKGSLLRRQGAQPQNLPFLSKFFRDSKNQLPPHQPLRQNRKEEMGDGDLLSFEGGWVQRVHSSPPHAPSPHLHYSQWLEAALLAPPPSSRMPPLLSGSEAEGGPPGLCGRQDSASPPSPNKAQTVPGPLSPPPSSSLLDSFSQPHLGSADPGAITMGSLVWGS